MVMREAWNAIPIMHTGFDICTSVSLLCHEKERTHGVFHGGDVR